ncbi:MAG: hemolysin, partial [Bacteroidaceae bacterium]|nr:hemolysin [Bacteroidaceae bacterium]
NLWDGLGALTVAIPNVKYLFGKVTMYPSYNKHARDLILYFLRKHFADPDKLIEPITPLCFEEDEAGLAQVICGEDFKSDYRILKSEVRKVGLSIPPLVNAYMGLSPTMKIFGTAINTEFSNVEETGIFIAVNEIIEDKYVRYIESFAKENPDAIKLTSGANKVFYNSSDSQ